MLVKVVCNNEECINAGIEYFLPEQTDDVMCGGCATMIPPVETVMEPPQLPDFFGKPLS